MPCAGLRARTHRNQLRRLVEEQKPLLVISTRSSPVLYSMNAARATLSMITCLNGVSVEPYQSVQAHGPVLESPCTWIEASLKTKDLSCVSVC